MKKLSGYLLATLALISITGVLFLSAGCTDTNHEGFAVYLTQEDIPPAQMPALSHIDIAEQPVIAMDDIVTYNKQTHELKLTARAYEAVAQLEVPVRGKSFVVCVDRQPVYWGAFWTPVSSMSFDGVTIWKPLTPAEPYIVTFELGYPSASFYEGDDPRDNPEILASLEQAGKLILRLSITEVDKLPRSMKGYELYSWLADGQWRFTLITGTNRNKTLAEVTSGEDFVSETGWVNIHVTGVDMLQTVLGKLPPGESVSWLAGLREEPAPQGAVEIALPPGPTIDTIKEYAAGCGLDLTVQTT